MGMRLCLKTGSAKSAQMAVELVACIPAMIIVAVIVTNAVYFFSECAAYDNAFRGVVRICAASPEFGQNPSDTLRLIESEMDQLFEDGCKQSAVEAQTVYGGHMTFTGTLTLHPTLFGMGLRDQVFGIALPAVAHSVSITIDSYKPGAIF